MTRRHLGWLCAAVALAAVARPVGGQTAAVRMASETADATITLVLHDVDVRSAIEALFKSSGRNYSIDGNVSGTVSSLSFKGVSFDTALKSLTRSLGLVYRIDPGKDEIYMIGKRREPDSGGTPPHGDGAGPAFIPDPGPEEAPKTIIEKVSLTYSSPAEILDRLGATPREYAMATGYGGRYGSYGYGSPGPGYGYGTGYGYPGSYSPYGNNGGLSNGYGAGTYGAYGTNGGYNYGNYNYGTAVPAGAIRSQGGVGALGVGSGAAVPAAGGLARTK